MIAYRNLMRRAKMIALGIFLFGTCIFCATFFTFLHTPLLAKTPSSEPIHFILPVGGTTLQLSNQLVHLKLLNYPREYFLLLAILMRADGRLHAGEYVIEPGMGPMQLLHNIITGHVFWRKLLFVEGWTFKQFRQTLDHDPYIIHKTLGLSDAEVGLLLNKTGSLEGLFFPATYRYTAGFSDVAILQQAAQTMQKHLQAAWQTRAAHLFYQTPYQALIVASMVEKEAKLKQDRPLIAGVILKRLSINMPLQIDATVIYGLGDEYHGRLTTADLKIPTAYNTYLHKGLPPTPIAMPGEASLQAAMHPIIDHDLFYVARGDGGHVFSATLAGQNKAVRHYRLLEHEAA